MRNVLAFTATAGMLAACGSPKATMFAGGITTTIGVIGLANASSNQCDSEFCPFGGLEQTSASLLVLTAGAIITLIGLRQDHEQDGREAPAAQVATPTPTSPQPMGATPPSSTPPLVLKPLPAASLEYTDPSQRRFAFQASAAAMRGDCAAARVAGDRLPIDIEQSLISVDANYARCLP